MTFRLCTVILLIVVLEVRVKGHGMMVGGLTEEQPPRPDVQMVVNAVRPKVEERLGHPLQQFKVLSFKTQLVAGTNYFVKMDIGEDAVVHVRVYRNLQDEITLTDMQTGKGRDDAIIYF